MLSVMIVDDEAPARRYMQRLLAAHKDISIVGEATSRQTAIQRIGELKPDVVFLDVELGDGNGMEMWGALTYRPKVIFVTAHADYAWRAFEVEAVDYLLKPVRAERLALALEKIRQAHAPRPSSLVIRSQGAARIIPTERISAIVASGDYVELRMANSEMALMYGTLTRIAQELPSPPFLKLSRSLLLNLDHVSRTESDGPAQLVVTFSSGATPLALGRAAGARLRKALADR